MPVNWSEGGRDLMGQDDVFWESPPTTSAGGFASDLVAKRPVCGTLGSPSVTYQPDGDLVASTNQPGQTVGFVDVTHFVTVTVILVDGRTVTRTYSESESAAKKPPMATDLDLFPRPVKFTP